MTRVFSVTWDYRCPFARNVHEHVLAGLAAGADWRVDFVPFSLGQVHVEEGQPDVWEKPEQDRGILALQVGVVVRDRFPDSFPDVHRGLFAARHDKGLHIEDRAVVGEVLTEHGVDPDEAFAPVDDGSALTLIRAEHERAVEEAGVWGVPTFVVDGEAAFVRLMDRPAPENATPSIAAIERILDLLATWPDLNEFKHTTVPR